ncbi:MAG: hypothetical protein GX945_10910 [Lentisphaerae bacterium]|nr:hypothetical protein [Lentisphaerota bacterium]
MVKRLRRQEAHFADILLTLRAKSPTVRPGNKREWCRRTDRKQVLVHNVHSVHNVHNVHFINE